jgi:hypothetical protein
MLNVVLALLTLFVSSVSAQLVRGYGSDSLTLQEIADSLHVPFRNNTSWVENGRVTKLSIYYGGQTGAIPPALGKLDSLHYLFVSLNRVTSLPHEIGLLKRMDTIMIGSSFIGPSLPDEIGDLPNLRFLSVEACDPLKTLPTSLMRLKNLEYVNFSNNSICSLDDSLRNWILAINPNALANQKGCAATGIGKGNTSRESGPDRKLALPGHSPAPAYDRDADGKTRYYSPAGRRLDSKKAGPGV